MDPFAYIIHWGLLKLTDMKIGIFDSGLGGLTIMAQLLKKLPQYDYVYFGDNARVPYGGRSKKIIYQFAQQGIKFLFDQNCLLVILACNTTSTNALKKLQREFLPDSYPNHRVLGVVIPTIEELIDLNSRRIGLIGTRATINSNAYSREIKKTIPDAKVFEQTTPLLVPIIEEGETNWPGLNSILTQYLSPLLRNNIDSLVLGCTHYGIVYKQIKKIVGPKIKIIRQEELIPRKLESYLRHHQEIEHRLDIQGKTSFFVSDLNSQYYHFAERLLGFRPKLIIKEWQP